MTMQYTNELLDLLGEQVEITLKKFDDIEKSLAQLPVTVRATLSTGSRENFGA